MTRLFSKTALVGAASLIALAACGQSGQGGSDVSSGPPPVKLETAPAGQLPEGVTPTAYRLDLVTDPAADTFSGLVEIDIDLAAPHARIWLHALGPTVNEAKAVLADGTEIPAAFESGLADGGVSKLDFETPVPAGAATLVMTYDAPYNFGLAGLYKASQAGEPYLATQMEPIDARRMLPSFDEPRFKTPWTVTVTAPADDEVIANGAEVSSERVADGMVRHTFAETRPIQTYLVALAVGPYDEVVGTSLAANDVRAEPVPFRAFAPAGKGDKLQTAMDATAAMVDWQESYFDYPYPYGKLDLIAVPEFAYGAMENAGAIVYREAALLIDERTSLARRRGVLTTHAHELGHQWFGNLVTPIWWDDIWLTEAFATWISYKTMHAVDPEGGFDRSATRAALGAMGADSLAAARQIRNPIERNADILDGFDAITYRKGGGVLSMFENYLGEEQFRDGMRLHMRRFEDGVADVDDFMQSLADGSGEDTVVDAFRSFIFQPGIPLLDVQISCAEDGANEVSISQSRYAPLGSDIDPSAQWIVPFSMTVADDVATRPVSGLLDGADNAIALTGACPNWVMPNAGGAGYWRFATSAENWAALTESFETLTPGEQLVFADSLGAGFRAGAVDAASLLTGVEATRAGEWDAVQQGVGQVSGLVRILDEDDKPAMRAWLRDTYGEMFADLAGRDDLAQGEQLLLRTLQGLMSGVAQEPELRADLLDRAGRYVGVDGDPDQSALAPGELGAAMSVGAEEGGRAFYDAAMDVARASQNQTERATIFGALAGNAAETETLELMDATFGDDLSNNEAVTVYFSALGNEAAQDAVWDQFKTRFDEVAANVPEIRRPQMGGVAGVFCDADKVDDAVAFIESKADQIPGYERSLAQGAERARLCAALKEAKADELVAALAAR